MITFIAALFLVCALASGVDGQNVRALSFGRTTADYVQFRPGDMSPFSTSFTTCSWMKRLHDASQPIVLHYYPGNVIIGDNGYWNQANNDLDLTGKFPEANQWFHYCLSWVSGGTQRVYVNGVELGSTSASARTLHMGGTIALGRQVGAGKFTSYVFGGQLHKLNWYSEELTSSQIRDMFEAGLCSTVEEEFSSRELKWELILTKQRYGNVTEFLPTECEIDCKTKLKKTEVKLATIEQKLQKVTETLNDTLTELQEVTETLNDTLTELNGTKADFKETKIVLQEKETKLNGTQQKLQEVTETLNYTLSDLTETETELNGTKTLLEEARRLETVSKWDVLFTPPYLNKLFTRQLYSQLTNWMMMGKSCLLFSVVVFVIS